MTQTEVDRAVSHVTGESMETIKRRGFSILPFPGDYPDEEPDALPVQIVDWDRVDAARRRAA